MSDLSDEQATAAREAGWLPVDEVTGVLNERGYVRLEDVQARINDLLAGIKAKVKAPDCPFSVTFVTRAKNGLAHRHAMALLAKSRWHAKVVVGGWHERTQDVQIEAHHANARAVVLDAAQGVLLPDSKDVEFRAGLEQGATEGAQNEKPKTPSHIPATPDDADDDGRAAWTAGYRLGYRLAGVKSEESTSLLRVLDLKLAQHIQEALR